jgi:hypothetical protein
MNAFPVPGRGLGGWMLAVVLLMSGCSTSDIDRIPQEIGGLPAGAPARLAEPPAYPAVHDMPPSRTAGVLDAEQQKKLEADLIATRNRQPNQQKNIARDKAKAEKAAKAKAAKENKASKSDRKRAKASGQSATQPPTAAGQSAPGTPPWPVPPQSTGGSPRP